MSLIPFPIFYPSPYRAGRSHYSDYGTQSAVRSLEQSGERNHNQLMQAINELGKQKLAITVIASEILPAVAASFNRLEGPVRDYEKAHEKWESRFIRVTDKWDRRKDEREQRARDAKADKYVAENLEEAQRKDARIIVAARSSWWRTYSFDKALEEVRSGNSAWHVTEVKIRERELRSKPYSYYDSYYGLFSEISRPKTTQPKPPAGYKEFSAIKEVYEVANAAQNAMLTIPSETMRHILEFAK